MLITATDFEYKELRLQMRASLKTNGQISLNILYFDTPGVDVDVVMKAVRNIITKDYLFRKTEKEFFGGIVYTAVTPDTYAKIKNQVVQLIKIIQECP